MKSKLEKILNPSLDIEQNVPNIKNWQVRELLTLIETSNSETVKGFRKWLEYNLQLDELGVYSESRFKKILRENENYYLTQQSLSKEKE